MRRRRAVRSFSLTVRMILVGAVLLAFYAALGTFSVWLAVSQWHRSALFVFVPAAFALLVLIHVTLADAGVLARSAARHFRRADAPDLHATVERLAGLAGITPPRLALSTVRVPNAFAVGTTPRRATIAVTQQLRSSLDARELEAVLAHELAHIATRDTLVLTFPGFFRTLAAVLDGRVLLGAGDERFEDDPLGQIGAWAVHVALAPLRWTLLLFGAALTRALTRYRDFVADRAGVTLTGAPEQLMSALQKIDGDQTRIPDEDLRQLAAADDFLIVSRRRGMPSFLREHPPLAKRLDRLATIAREMGKLR